MKNSYQFSVKLKKNTDQRVLDFIAFQSNICDTILYLIQKEIAENGVRNLQMVIPPIRDIDTFFSNSSTGILEDIKVQERNNLTSNIPTEYDD